MPPDGEQGLALHARHEPDLVVLDLMLPRIDGFEVCRELRRRGDTPILMLTARDDDVDAIVGLELGADDYVTKPFNPRALVARVKAILRRTDVMSRGGRPMEVGPLRIDPRRREATVGERQLDLRAREFDLLAALARDPGVVLTRDGLLEDVWGTDFPGETRTIDVHVAEVRKKLGPGRAADRDRPRRRLPARAAAARAGPADPLRSLGPGWAGCRRPPDPTAPTDSAMPRGLTARIALAFVGVAIVTWLAIGGTLFIILRGLHAQTTGGRLEDQATALAVQARQAVNVGDTATRALDDPQLTGGRGPARLRRDRRRADRRPRRRARGAARHVPDRSRRPFRDQPRDRHPARRQDVRLRRDRPTPERRRRA